MRLRSFASSLIKSNLRILSGKDRAKVILLLRSTAGLLVLAALALLLRPSRPIALLDLTSSRELEWSFRVVGIGNLGMAALLTLAAAYFFALKGRRGNR